MLQVDGVEQFVNGFGAHASIEIVTELFEGLEVLLVVQQLALSRVVMPGSITT